MRFRDADPCDSRRAPRRGIASLEYVMSLPVLLILFAVIISTAYLGLGRVGVAVETRNEAWTRRDQARSARPLFFTQQEQPIVQDGNRRVRVTPFVQGPTVTATSHHAVLGATWDYRELAPCDEPFKTVRLM